MMNRIPSRIAVFISGGGSNLQALIDASKTGVLSGEIALVVSSSEKAFGLTRAEEAKIPTFVVKPKKHTSQYGAADALLQQLREHKIEFIALAGYLKLLEPQVISSYNGRIINIHPALLPRYGGKGMYGIHVHKAVLAAGDKESGVSFHLVDEHYDHGRIVKQVNVPVLENDTPESLQKRILEEEHKHYPIVLDNFIKGEYDNN